MVKPQWETKNHIAVPCYVFLPWEAGELERKGKPCGLRDEC